MVALRLIDPRGPRFDPTYLDIIDVPFFLIAIVLIFIAYYKIKKTKKLSRKADKSN